MTVEELKAVLEASGLPVAYRVFKTPTSLPFICFLEAGSNNFGADGIVYHRVRRIDVELYTAVKDPETEQKTEDALTGAGFYFERYEQFIESENMYEIIYEIEV